MKPSPYFFNALKTPELRIFLCGPELNNRFTDIRNNVKTFLKRQANAQCFLGEEISNIILADDNHLKIETNRARRSDIVIIFLGSPGTYAELGAFTLDTKVRDKLLVFNDQKYKGKKSFLNDGPLKWLKNFQLIWYDPQKPLDEHVFYCLDSFLMRIRFESVEYKKFPFNTFENYFTYINIYTMGGCDSQSLIKRLYLNEKQVATALKTLLLTNYLKKRGKIFYCSQEMPHVPEVLFKRKKLSEIRCKKLADLY